MDSVNYGICWSRAAVRWFEGAVAVPCQNIYVRPGGHDEVHYPVIIEVPSRYIGIQNGDLVRNTPGTEIVHCHGIFNHEILKVRSAATRARTDYSNDGGGWRCQIRCRH